MKIFFFNEKQNNTSTEKSKEDKFINLEIRKDYLNTKALIIKEETDKFDYIKEHDFCSSKVIII